MGTTSKKTSIRQAVVGAIALFLVLIVLFLVGCGKSLPIAGAKQNTQHIVQGNGSTAVQYGNYMYFVNGFRGFDDPDGDSNNSVTKGGIFRAELFNNGEIGSDFETRTYYETHVDDIPDQIDWERDNPELVDYEFVNHMEKDPNAEYEDDDEIVVATVNQIADKTVGTSGYKNGGIYIFDDNLYFASPSNERDRNGTLLTNHTMFFKVNLHTGQRQDIYSTRNDAQDLPYAFYKFGGNVYLAAQDGTDIVSVLTTGKRGKVGKPQIVAQKVTKAVMPVASIYYKDMPEDYIENFVYFTQKPDQTWSTGGNVLQMIRPDGSQGREILNRSTESTPVELHSVNDGLLFYTIQDTTESPIQLHYDNLWSLRRELARDAKSFDDNNTIDTASFETKSDMAWNKSVYINEQAPVRGVALTASSDEYTSFYAFRPNRNSNMPFVLASNSSGVRIFDGNANASRLIINDEVTVLFVREGLVYFIDDANSIARSPYGANANSTQREVLSSQPVETTGLSVSVAGDYLVFNARLDEWADNYAFFKKLTNRSDTREIFVGQRRDEDKRPDDDDDTDNGGGDEGEDGGDDGDNGDNGDEGDAGETEN